MTDQRFDEVELRVADKPQPFLRKLPRQETGGETAPLWRRALSLIVDLSLLAALLFAFKPLHPPDGSILGWVAMALFVTLFSLYYFTVSWMVWGRTMGAAILAIRVSSDDEAGVTFRRALRRWAGTILSIATAGIGFLLAVLPRKRSLADRLSDTIVVRGS